MLCMYYSASLYFMCVFFKTTTHSLANSDWDYSNSLALYMRLKVGGGFCN